MANINYPKTIWKKKRAKEIEEKVREIYKKEIITLLDISIARILITEYKVLMNWEQQKEEKKVYHFSH